MRPRQLGNLIRCFERQDYPNRELVILDDAGQYTRGAFSITIPGDRWRLYSQRDRYASLGEKRNAVAALASPDADAIAIWDDDDLYLPHALTATAAALEAAEWSRPSLVLHPYESEPGRWAFRKHETGGLYHGGYAYRREMFQRMGGYRAGYSGPEDQELMQRMEAAGVTQADPIALGFEPFYIYPWGQLTGSYHISGMLTGKDTGQQAWDRIGRLVVEPAELAPVDPPWFDLGNPIVDDKIYPRPF
jgi:hypothetical protein